MLALSLAVLLALLLLAAWAQVAWAWRRCVRCSAHWCALREGRTRKLEGPAPAEVQPLVDGFNAVLEHNAQVVQRARQQAGNLAHAVKTPLAVLGQAAEAARRELAARCFRGKRWRSWRGWCWSRSSWRGARSTGTLRAPAPPVGKGCRASASLLEPVLRALLRVMDKVHAARALELRCAPIGADLAFAGEEQDLQEILGNLLDNACKWARTVVSVQARLESAALPARAGDHGAGRRTRHRAGAARRGAGAGRAHRRVGAGFGPGAGHRGRSG